MDGLLKVYYENGQLKKTGTYSNGLANGKFIEYDENGDKSFEYIMSKGNKNGKLTAYENNEVSYTSFYKNDIRNGEYLAFYYNKETGELDLKLIGSYLDGEKEGLWRLVYIDKEGWVPKRSGETPL
jgi:antitoxin component YwqK of YwqJK toxin-antitoxin module